MTDNTQLKKDQWQLLFCDNTTPIIQMPIVNDVKLMVKRDDLNHPVIQGNKLRKLKYNIKHAIDHHYDTVATFGGAWSNHILATAAAAKACGLNSIGFIRGDELINQPQKWSQTLVQAKTYDMQLVFISRHDYRLKFDATVVKKHMTTKHRSIWPIPEGGSNALALAGVEEVIEELSHHSFDYLLCACGTGGTMAGLIDGVAKHKNIKHIIGITVLKGADYLTNKIRQLSTHHHEVNWHLRKDYHAGGYAKIDNKTLTFAQNFSRNNNIPLDRVYTAKTFFAAYDLINQGIIAAGSSVAILHTGGLQAGIIQ